MRESIADPEKVVVSGYPAGVMPTNFGTSLTSAQIDALGQVSVGRRELNWLHTSMR